ncbi:MAG: monovalent cation/H+ antiporter subunit D family protein [Desulfobacterales bacterium]|jgi:multicomponent Na+:H+ antiporter subunit D|nr:monovalent cation/H+ antiporter subunit D family protein [Desulfobacterales bacterium]
MAAHYPVLIVVVPLLSVFLISLAGWVNRRYCFPIAVLSLATAFSGSILLFCRVLEEKSVTYLLGGWPAPWGIAYKVDALNGLVLVMVLSVAMIHILATRQSVEETFAQKAGAFYTLYVLFITGLLGIVVTGDAFNLYVLLEIASLTGYALIGLGEDRSPLASLNYLFMGTLGASFYLLGIGYLYMITGTLNMADLGAMLPAHFDSRVVVFAFIICLTGLFIKMALFPLHAWLPNAYTQAPAVVTSLVAPLTTKVMVYVMIRITLTVFTPAFAFDRPVIGDALVRVASVAIVAGSLLALSQRCLKKMMAFVIVAEVGYMVGGLWLGNRNGVSGAILHVINDAAMMLCLFLAIGNILHQMKTDALSDLKGLFRKMPVSMAGFVAAGLSIIGVPPTCGFFSKWYLILGGISKGHWEFVAALIFSSLINVVLFFRIIEIGYFEPVTDHDHGKAAQREAPMGMTAPLVFTAMLLIAMGIYSGEIVTRVIYPALPAGIL